MIYNPRFKLENIFFDFFLINLTGFLGSRHAQLAIYTVFDEESESEVKKCQILEPGGKI